MKLCFENAQFDFEISFVIRKNWYDVKRMYEIGKQICLFYGGIQ